MRFRNGLLTIALVIATFALLAVPPLARHTSERVHIASAQTLTPRVHIFKPYDDRAVDKGDHLNELRMVAVLEVCKELPTCRMEAIDVRDRYRDARRDAFLRSRLDVMYRGRTIGQAVVELRKSISSLQSEDQKPDEVLIEMRSLLAVLMQAQQKNEHLKVLVWHKVP